MGFVLSSIEGAFQYLILSTIFMTVTVSSMVLLRSWQSSKALNKRAIEARRPRARARAIQKQTEPDEVEDAPLNPNDPVAAYYAAYRAARGNDTRQRLLKAGYTSPDAYTKFTNLRLGLGMGFGLVAMFAMIIFAGIGNPGKLAMLSVPLAGLGYMLPTFILDKMVKTRKRKFEIGFPDIIDMLVVCLEAGLTFEAAVNRIAKDTRETDSLLSLHLQIVMLELRAGRSMREALSSFAERIDVNDARSLISFVRQSEELGVSIGQSLRVFAAELRQKRALLAEEKANALPAKMLLPIAMFLFPVTLAIVLAPVLVSLMEFFHNGM